MPNTPNLICPGAQKSGTTTLYAILKQHPEIYGPRNKEPAFFTRFYDEGLEWYKGLYKDRGAAKYVMDFSVDYMLSERAVERIHKDLSDDA